MSTISYNCLKWSSIISEKIGNSHTQNKSCNVYLWDVYVHTQVAEMHGELMELNEKLQWNISAKEAIIRRLYLELEALRGPLGPSQIDIHSHIISLWLPSVFLSGSSKPHHVYQVRLDRNTFCLINYWICLFNKLLNTLNYHQNYYICW